MARQTTQWVIQEGRHRDAGYVCVRPDGRVYVVAGLKLATQFARRSDARSVLAMIERYELFDDSVREAEVVFRPVEKQFG